MKLSVAILALSVSAASAFAPQQISTQSVTELKATSNRAAFLSQLTAAAVGVAFLQPSPALAAKYGGFGAGSPEVLDPKEAIVDTDILATASVQGALKGVKGYLSTVLELKSTLAKDSQADIGPSVRRQLDFSKIRADLNNVNEAFDEDTQRGTDRIIRIILQDITELEAANTQKPGIPRSERRLGIMNAKLTKLQTAFEDYLKFV
uniref:Uncharacterized protein n=1 Tax=Attheya septentrionalis TaxID=420275 RepID=A0A7S2UA53_9STRA|mmetsp:Transcript_15036/g.27265  ORF Transcript_15036/g.27265 Transcript_15036/m.27265 type:complete len:206 (+) Transcript_15036:69-686(+)|eukprot:CAMPEP_0198289744 /NCGR_PEP_ID=MMETSP1449-20131203/7835_1 /TAXON_ID=420275 /ORGANISM="Attheya septentrionalis, Strain CCMP2084" /LENGTH=205 /DNA_ID=CAMNT_0043988125 /DNA_START=67 /DNA_END=684 /DNA_ORIENTATION=+